MSLLYKEMSEVLAGIVPAALHSAVDMALCDILVGLPVHDENPAALLAAMMHEVIFELALLTGDTDAGALTDKLLEIIAAKTETQAATGAATEAVAAVAA